MAACIASCKDCGSTCTGLEEEKEVEEVQDVEELEEPPVRMFPFRLLPFGYANGFAVGASAPVLVLAFSAQWTSTMVF